MNRRTCNENHTIDTLIFVVATNELKNETAFINVIFITIIFA